ncbi:MAG: SBBP repeat-containing protein [Ignavibacteria bacterium]|nr:SBBP repeat-containing protein [Ignavibacteria bacterium]MBK8381879.1 SBBP repeat-containing protein [Ignavibacteria bacterium]MBL0106257.1 SBBP repeat-containing protein [Ignavibacteria bacterium]
MNNITKIFLTLLLTVSSVNYLFSQVTQEWVSRFSQITNSNDGASAIIVDSSDNIYITGGSIGAGTQSDYVTIKYNSNGIQQWIKIYNGSGNGADIADAIAIDKENNIYVTGESMGILTGIDCVTIKYNSSGIQQWIARYSTPGNHRDASYRIALDNSGNVIVAGESYNSNLSQSEYCTIKYDNFGSQLWVRNYHAAGIIFALAVDNSNNIYVNGSIADSPTQEDYATIRYDSFGNQIWLARYDGSAHMSDYTEHLVIDDSANVYVSGYTTGLNTGPDFTTIKYNSSGVRKWIAVYDGPSHSSDVVRSIGIDNKNNIYVTGTTIGPGTGYDWVTIKYNSDGVQQWITKFNNGTDDTPWDLAVDIQGNVYITGESDGNGTGDDYATIKYNSVGQQQWLKRYDFSGVYGDVASSIAVDKSGSVFVTGSSDRDFLTIKYSQLTGAITNLSEIQTEYKLSQNYPNPFNPETVIRYQLTSSSFASVVVCDVLGNEVKTLLSNTKPAGNYEVEFNGGYLPSGIYFYSLLIDGNVIDTKRMILLK